MALNARKSLRERVDDFEAQIILSDSQKDSILRLQEACSELPFPTHLQGDDDNEQDDDQQQQSTLSLVTPSRSRAPSFMMQDALPARAKANETTTRKSTHELMTGVDDPIENTQQFFGWFARIEEDMEVGQEDIYRSYLESIYTYRKTCDNVLSTIASTRDLLNSLKENYESVDQKTRGLQLACEKLLAEQMHLLHVADQVAVKLNYFNDLEPISKLFSSPGETVCLDDKFIPFLHRLDECIAFVQSNLNYKDAELFLMRFRQCMTRGMSLVKLHIVNTLRGLQTDVRDRLANRPPNEVLPASLHTSLFYVKFKTVAPRLKALVAEIESRVPSHKEYHSLLQDCYNAFFQVRASLLGPQIQLHVQEISNDKDLLSFARSGSVYMTGVCRDEYTLFFEFFSSGQDELSGYLESLSMHLYDALRPLILRESRIDILSDLCLAIQAAMASQTATLNLVKPVKSQPDELEQDGEQSEEINGDEEDENGYERRMTKQQEQEAEDDGLGFVTASVRLVLEDTQSRLAFRAQTFIKQDIQGFKPREDEILLFARGRGLPLPAPVSTSTGFAPVITAPNSPEATTSTTSITPANTMSLSITESTDGDPFALAPPPLAPNSAIEPARRPSADISAPGFARLVYGSGEWYPTMQRCLYILGKLYRCVPTTVFEDLAEEAVDECRASLVGVSLIIALKQTKTDGELFLIKNLLMLREQIAPFEVAFVRKEEILDFGALQAAVSTVLSDPLSFGNLSQAVMAGVSLPRTVESYPDAKEGVDKELKRVCEDFILDTTRSCVEPLSSFLLKVQVFRLRDGSSRSSSVPRESLAAQNFAQPAQVLQIQDAFREVLSKRLGYAISRMADYLGDKRTEAVLIRVMRANIIDTYQAFYDIVQTEYDLSVQGRVTTVDSIAKMIDAVCSAVKAPTMEGTSS
ncbi:hypothetical protein SmJEL517_g04569 [Synchytrium microbalum]|uniref:Conserved oligomeric Golgi complex subunit 3 n=1 Tax=Synchytrium microbalum TaxID=1806994 RepID=A0A507C2D9_9FUNG|nr:uncharacterized protein SmJEL517_g04569 [Synchytrium microbalum]TPX32254.1 hypothetical protein SmJEL517_g04569 [Synchytrium microbalum]